MGPRHREPRGAGDGFPAPHVAARTRPRRLTGPATCPSDQQLKNTSTPPHPTTTHTQVRSPAPPPTPIQDPWGCVRMMKIGANASPPADPHTGPVLVVVVVVVVVGEWVVGGCAYLKTEPSNRVEEEPSHLLGEALKSI